MRLPAVAQGVSHTVATIDIHGCGEYGQAVSAFLAASGHQVKLVGNVDVAPAFCDIHTNGARYSTPIRVQTAAPSGASSDVIVIAAEGTEYGAVCEDVVDSLRGGQVVLLIGASFGASFEVARLFNMRRPELALNIVEVSRPFSSYEVQGDNVRLYGTKTIVTIAGRTLNETRAGLQAAGMIFPSVVPASNVIERAFADADKWLDTARSLFTMFKGQKQELANVGAKPSSPQSFAPNKKAAQSCAVSTVVSAFHAELSSLARAYHVSRIPAVDAVAAPSTAQAERALERVVIEDFVILSNLGRLAYVQTPMLDSVIELASVLTSTELRNEARQLSDLGLVGLDSREILEHVSA